MTVWQALDPVCRDACVRAWRYCITPDQVPSTGYLCQVEKGKPPLKQ